MCARHFVCFFVPCDTYEMAKLIELKFSENITLGIQMALAKNSGKSTNRSLNNPQKTFSFIITTFSSSLQRDLRT